MDIYPQVVQRPELLKFAEALRSRVNALRRDECGDWRINGGKGHIYAVPEGFQIMVSGWSANGWNRAKQTMTFATVTQDGDAEGGLIMERLPTPAEADEIRHYCKIAKRTEYSEEYRAELRERMSRFSPKSDRKTTRTIRRYPSDRSVVRGRNRRPHAVDDDGLCLIAHRRSGQHAGRARFPAAPMRARARSPSPMRATIPPWRVTAPSSHFRRRREAGARFRILAFGRRRAAGRFKVPARWPRLGRLATATRRGFSLMR